MIAQIAETFHVLPNVVAQDLDEDPERLSLTCVSLLRYAEAKQHEENAKDADDMKMWKGSKLMEEVLRNKFQLHRERVARRGAEERTDG